MRSVAIVSFALLLSLPAPAPSLAAAAEGDAGGRLSGAVSRLEGMRDRAAADVARFDGEVRKWDGKIAAAEGLVSRARQQGNGKAEGIALQALAKAREAKGANERNRSLAERNRSRAEALLARVRGGGKGLEAALEQAEFETMNAEWMRKQNDLISGRLAVPNRYAGELARSLREKAPPPPWKDYDKLLPGDVLLLEGKGVAAADTFLSSGREPSKASHTVIFLKEVNGEKLYLDNQPEPVTIDYGKPFMGNQRYGGPRIITEQEFFEEYGGRGTEVARLAQPLNEKEGKELFSAAVEMARKNRQEVGKNWLGSPLLGTNYGAWGKGNVVCSEADWMLLNQAMKERPDGAAVPATTDVEKRALGVDFSPADFRNSPYFLVTPLGKLPAAPPKR
jgi:hypothetical protein